LAARYLKVAQRYLPYGAHRPFQVFLADYARKMQQLMRGSLYVGLALAMVVSVFLRVNPDLDESSKDLVQATWMSPVAEHIAHTLGALYFACTMVWVILNACIKVPLSFRMKSLEYRSFYITLLLSCGVFWQQKLPVASIFAGLFWNCTIVSSTLDVLFSGG